MTIISPLELGTHINDVLDRVRNGETISVSTDGEVVATLIPPSLSPFERSVRSGQVRPASSEASFQCIERVRGGATTMEILADLRGDN